MRLSLFKQLIFSISCLSSLWSASENVEFKVGLMNFTVSPTGAIRTYYHDNSNIKGIAYYDGNGVKYATQDFDYDEKDRVKTRTLDQKVSCLFIKHSVFDYKYTEDNKLDESLQKYITGSRRSKRIYNDDGYLDKIQIQDIYLQFLTKGPEVIQHIYTTDGQLSCKTYFNSNKVCILKQTWSYDQFGRLSVFQTFDGNGKLIWGVDYSYADADTDAHAIATHETTFDAEQQAVLYTSIQIYKDHLIKERSVCNSQGELISRTSIEYNHLDKPIHLYDIDHDEVLIGAIHTYYDKQDRPYQHDFRYQDSEIFQERIHSYLQLPEQGN